MGVNADEPHRVVNVPVRRVIGLHHRPIDDGIEPIIGLAYKMRVVVMSLAIHSFVLFHLRECGPLTTRLDGAVFMEVQASAYVRQLHSREIPPSSTVGSCST